MPQGKYAQGSIMKRGSIRTAKPVAAETVSTSGPWVETDDSGSVYVRVVVSAVTGTSPTLLVWIEGSQDMSSAYTIGKIGANGYSVGSTATDPTNLTGAATVEAFFTCPQFVRYRSVIGGTTPNFTYKVDLEVC